jgi:phosphoribosylanthranilate isomerase
MTRVKICGIMSMNDLSCAVQNGADAVGFVVEVPESHRSVSADFARELIERVPVFTASVAVIVPENIAEAEALALETGADILQIHGKFGREELNKLRGLVSQKIVAALPAVEGTYGFAKSIEGAVDGILIDTYREDKMGGTGEVHDWSISAGIVTSLNLPVILAGGLTPGNVSEAIGKVRPYAVDVSGGVETNKKKDCDKIAAFISEVRSCQQL